MLGKEFHYWKILRGGVSIKDKDHRHWLCRCKCGTERLVKESSLLRGKSLSCGCQRSNLAPKEKNHPNFKKGKVGYFTIHVWLRKNFGKADLCENPKCLRLCKNYEWAKIKEKNYERIRENYIKLCKSCHHTYDMTQAIKVKISQTLKGRPSPMRGKRLSQETRNKMSMSHTKND